MPSPQVRLSTRQSTEHVDVAGHVIAWLGAATISHVPSLLHVPPSAVHVDGVQVAPVVVSGGASITLSIVASTLSPSASGASITGVSLPRVEEQPIKIAISGRLLTPQAVHATIAALSLKTTRAVIFAKARVKPAGTTARIIHSPDDGRPQEW